jgi:hypothetical protein
MRVLLIEDDVSTAESIELDTRKNLAAFVDL